VKRGSFLKRHVRLKAVSAKVKAAKPAYDAVYRAVDARSGGRCEVTLPFRAVGYDRAYRCLDRATEHHHTRRPRRLAHRPSLVMAICRRHHNDVRATFANGRLWTEANGDGTFTCAYRFKPENPFK